MVVAWWILGEGTFPLMIPAFLGNLVFCIYNRRARRDLRLLEKKYSRIPKSLTIIFRATIRACTTRRTASCLELAVISLLPLLLMLLPLLLMLLPLLLMLLLMLLPSLLML